MSRYLVTGGLGVVGSTIARRLLAQGHMVDIIDSAEERRNQWILARLQEEHDLTVPVLQKRIEHLTPEFVSGPLLRQVDAIIHAAASTGIPYSGVRPEDDWERNVEGTRVLLEGMRKSGRLIPMVVLSSVKPYRVTSQDLGVDGLDEETPLEADEPYAASKAAQSLLCQAYARSYRLPVAVFRCSNLYGAAPCHGPRHGWLTWFCISAAIGRAIEVQGSGNQSRDMLHAEDVGRACSALLAGLDAAPEKYRGQIYNLGGGRDNMVSVRQAADLLQELTGVKVTSGPGRILEDERVFASTAKFREATDWRPLVSVMDGIRETLSWAQRNAAALGALYEGVS